MKILHFSDTHLGYSNFDIVNEKGINTREQDFYDAFEFVFSQIREIKPDIILHTGDFFHRPTPSNRAMTFVLEQFKNISDLNIPFIIIAGNHSTPKTIYTSPILKALKTLINVYPIFDQKYEVIQLDNVAIHGLPHINDIRVQAEELDKVSLIPNKRNILMLHTSLGKKYLMDEYGEQVFPEEKIELLKQFDFIALGHWHNFQKVTILDNAYYSGSLERMSDSECMHEKGYCILEFNDKDPIIPVFIPIPTRKWHKIDILGCHQKSISDITVELNSFKEQYITQGCILNINFQGIKLDQSLELSNGNIKNIFDDVFNISIKRTSYTENNIISQIETGSFDKLDNSFAEFIKMKYSDEQIASLLIEKSNYYFNKHSTENQNDN